MDHLHKYFMDQQLAQTRQMCNKWIGLACLRLLEQILMIRGRRALSKAMSDLVLTMQLLEITSHRCMVEQVENKKDYKYKVHNGNVCYKGNNIKVQTLLELMESGRQEEAAKLATLLFGLTTGARENEIGPGAYSAVDAAYMGIPTDTVYDWTKRTAAADEECLES